MGLAQIRVDVVLDTTSCHACGINFAAPDWFLRARRSDGKSFFCPNGHSLAWNETEAQRLQKELDAERQRKLDVLSRLNEAETAKAKLERKLKRVDHGVCPECNRTFSNLARHMNCKHAK